MKILWLLLVLGLLSGCSPGQTQAQLMEYQIRLRCSNISIGMTMTEAEKVLGKPQRINTMVSQSGKTEIWIYSKSPSESPLALYFENGTLTFCFD